MKNSSATLTNRGYTILEVLTVMVIMMVLAGITYNTYSYFINDANANRAKAMLATLRTSIRLYRYRMGDYPPEPPATPWVSPYTYTILGTTQIFVFYEGGIPAEPFKGISDVITGTVPSSPTGAGGWYYDSPTGGKIKINLYDTEYGTTGSITKLSDNPSEW